MPNQLDKACELIAKRNQSLSLAESCTGGKVSAMLTEKSGISKIYLGSVVSYSNSMKIQFLDVPESQIRSQGAVSEVVAVSMAKGIKKRTGSDWAVSVTGVAGPSGGTKEKPVGTVCFGLEGPAISVSYRKFFMGNREQIQEQSVLFVWEILMKHLANDLN